MMDRQLADKLMECLDQVENQGKTISEAVSAFPEHADELKGLLEMANEIEGSATAAPRSEFLSVARVRLENRIVAQSAAKSEPDDVTFSNPLRHKHRKQQLIFRRFSMSWFIIVATVVSLVFGGSGVAYASTDALPGDGLYPVKTALQDLVLTFNGDEGDFELLLEYMDGNLAEMNQLLEQGRWDDIGIGLAEYQENLEKMVKTRTRLSYEDAHNEDALTVRLQQELHEQSQELLKLQNQLQEKNKLQNKVQEAIQQTDEGKTYGPFEGGKPEEGGSPNGAGPGEPKGDQQQGGEQRPEDANGPGYDECGRQKGFDDDSLEGEEDIICGENWEGNEDGENGNFYRNGPGR
jgi:hypothetical protein